MSVIRDISVFNFALNLSGQVWCNVCDKRKWPTRCIVFFKNIEHILDTEMLKYIQCSEIQSRVAL